MLVHKTSTLAVYIVAESNSGVRVYRFCRRINAYELHIIINRETTRQKIEALEIFVIFKQFEKKRFYCWP